MPFHPAEGAALFRPTALLRQRVQHRAAQGRDASEATLRVLEHQLETQEPLGADEAAHIFTVETGKG